jgi:hypothetical protein
MQVQKAFDWVQASSPEQGVDYWEDARVPEIPYYKYERVLPTVVGSGLADAYLRFTSRLTSRSDLQWRACTADRAAEYRASFRDGWHQANEGSPARPFVRPYQGDDSYAFVSYARDDRDRVLAVVQDLAELGFKVWWDEDITGGAEWRPYLEEKIRGSQHLLLFLSRRSVSSESVRQEIRLARELNKPLLSVRLDRSALGPEVAAMVSAYHMLDRSAAGFDEQLGKAMRFLNPSQQGT